MNQWEIYQILKDVSRLGDYYTTKALEKMMQGERTRRLTAKLSSLTRAGLVERISVKTEKLGNPEYAWRVKCKVKVEE